MQRSISELRCRKIGRFVVPPLVLGTLAILLAPSMRATAQMAVTPPRILLDRQDRSAEIVLTNQSSTILEVTSELGYTVGYSDSTGASGLREAQTPDEEAHRCDRWLRVFPSRFTIQPNSSHTVRLLITPTRVPEGGEYWGRLRLTGTPTTFDQVSMTDSAGGITTRIRTAVKLDLPVIFRVGKVVTSVSLHDIVLNRTVDSGLRVVTRTLRAGNTAYRGTLYGRLISESGDTVALASAQFTTEFEHWQGLSFERVKPGFYTLLLQAVATKNGSAMDVVIPSPTVEVSHAVQITDSIASVRPTR